jgi:ornithine cyclodeaminase
VPLRALSAAEVERLLSVAAAVPLMGHAFESISAGSGRYPLRVHVPLRDGIGDGLVMPAYDGQDAFGLKLVTVIPRNPAAGLPAVRALYLLVRAVDGEPLMLCDGATLTAIRTGAASGLATDVLARPDSRRGAVIGVGAQARTQLLAILAVRPLQSVAVYARHVEAVERFCAGMEPLVEARLEPAASAEQAVEDADVIVTATTSAHPVFDGRALKPGTHVNAVGAYRAEMRELDSYTIAHASLFVDSREAALAEAGDLIIPMQEGVLSRDQISGELGEVLLKRRPGRTSSREITVFKSVGLAVQDIVAASELYRRAVDQQVGVEVEL